MPNVQYYIITQVLLLIFLTKLYLIQLETFVTTKFNNTFLGKQR